MVAIGLTLPANSGTRHDVTRRMRTGRSGVAVTAFVTTGQKRDTAIATCLRSLNTRHSPCSSLFVRQTTVQTDKLNELTRRDDVHFFVPEQAVQQKCV
jgi:hypothetical protein